MVNYSSIVLEKWNEYAMGPDKECELCGREAYGLVRRDIEGVIMYVCSDCQEMGKEPAVDRKARARTVKKQHNTSKFQNMYGSGSRSGSSAPAQRSSSSSQSRGPRKPKLANLKIVDNAPQILLKTRMKQGLTTKEFAKSILIKDNYYKRIEKKTTAMSIDVARKFEKKYRLKLVEEEGQGEQDDEMSQFMANDSKPSDSMIYFKKRGQKPEYDQ
ncbi:MAG: helix-turn-helix domain-containing protein [Promethearchaeota archaeon]